MSISVLKGETTMEKANIGNTLKMLREERDLTMDMLVIDLNQKYQIEINKSQLSRWERNENDPSLALAAKLADYYGVSVDFLLGLTTVRVPARILAYNTLLSKGAKK
jgi:transcriptional regulator with XRE-family HTH domain